MDVKVATNDTNQTPGFNSLNQGDSVRYLLAIIKDSNIEPTEWSAYRLRFGVCLLTQKPHGKAPTNLTWLGTHMTTVLVLEYYQDLTWRA